MTSVCAPPCRTRRTRASWSSTSTNAACRSRATGPGGVTCWRRWCTSCCSASRWPCWVLMCFFPRPTPAPACRCCASWHKGRCATSPGLPKNWHDSPPNSTSTPVLRPQCTSSPWCWASTSPATGRGTPVGCCPRRSWVQTPCKGVPCGSCRGRGMAPMWPLWLKPRHRLVFSTPSPTRMAWCAPFPCWRGSRGSTTSHWRWPCFAACPGCPRCGLVFRRHPVTTRGWKTSGSTRPGN